MDLVSSMLSIKSHATLWKEKSSRTWSKAVTNLLAVSTEAGASFVYLGASADYVSVAASYVGTVVAEAIYVGSGFGFDERIFIYLWLTGGAEIFNNLPARNITLYVSCCDSVDCSQTHCCGLSS